VCKSLTKNVYQNRIDAVIDCLKDYAIKPYFHKNWKELKKISKE